MANPIVDERILASIPDHLIRPLLAISIRAQYAYTIAQCKQLMKEIDKLTVPCSEAGGESLYYIDVRNSLSLRMQAMLDAQKWAQKTDSTAEATGCEINRWMVNIHSSQQKRNVLVTYERAGVDRRRLEEKIRAVVTEAREEEV